MIASEIRMEKRTKLYEAPRIIWVQSIELERASNHENE
jgi:hypothetical protein